MNTIQQQVTLFKTGSYGQDTGYRWVITSEDYPEGSKLFCTTPKYKELHQYSPDNKEWATIDKTFSLDMNSHIAYATVFSMAANNEF